MDDSTLFGYPRFIQEAEKLKDAATSASTKTYRHESASEHFLATGLGGHGFC
jgi:hypothetical protein